MIFKDIKEIKKQIHKNIHKQVKIKQINYKVGN